MAALALVACGGDEVEVEVPRDVPDLTVPTTAEPARGEDGATEGTTAAPEGTEAAPDQAAPEGTEVAPEEGATPPEEEAPDGTGASSGAGGEETPTGGEYDAFCAQNPGACPTE